MGRVKRTGRKTTLQLQESKRPQGSKHLEYSTISVGSSAAFNPAASSEVAGESEEMESTKLTNFLQEMNSLANEQDAPAITKANGIPAVIEGVETQQPQQATRVDTTASEATITHWKEIIDAKTQCPYYWNPQTSETTWTLPEGGVILAEEGEGQGREELVDELMENWPQLKQEFPKPDPQATEELNITESKTEATPGKSTTVSGEKKSLPDTEMPAAKVESAKKSRSGGRSSGSTSPPKKVGVAASPVQSPSVGVVSKKAEQQMRFQVSGMINQFESKLKYLHVSVDNLTALETLAIQLETRRKDWMQGGLSTKYLQAKLKEMNSELRKCEFMAAPEGWQLVWDSISSRYKYINTSTGETSWETPVEDALTSDVSERMEFEDDAQQEADEMVGVASSLREESGQDEEEEEEEEEKVVMPQTQALSSSAGPPPPPVTAAALSAPLPPPAPPSSLPQPSISAPSVVEPPVAPSPPPSQAPMRPVLSDKPVSKASSIEQGPLIPPSRAMPEPSVQPGPAFQLAKTSPTLPPVTTAVPQTNVPPLPPSAPAPQTQGPPLPPAAQAPQTQGPPLPPAAQAPQTQGPPLPPTAAPSWETSAPLPSVPAPATAFLPPLPPDPSTRISAPSTDSLAPSTELLLSSVPQTDVTEQYSAPQISSLPQTEQYPAPHISSGPPTEQFLGPPIPSAAPTDVPSQQAPPLPSSEPPYSPSSPEEVEMENVAEASSQEAVGVVYGPAIPSGLQRGDNECEVERGRGAGERKEAYFGPTADFLGSQKLEEGATMPPPMPRYNKKALDIQRRQEEKEKLARIERESKPISKYDVREKLASKQPHWQRHMQRARERERPHPQVRVPSPEPLPPKDPRARPDEGCELILEFPPPNFDTTEVEEVKREVREVKPEVADPVRESSSSGRKGKRKSRFGPDIVEKSGESKFGRGFGAVHQKQTDSEDTDTHTTPVPPKPTTSILDLDTLRRGAEREESLREKLKFKIGKSSQDSSAGANQKTPSTSSAERAEPEVREIAPRSQAADEPGIVQISSDENVVESTGEMQRESVAQVSEEAGPFEPPPSTKDAPPPSSSSSFSSSFLQPQQTESRVEPETGIVEGEPGEIMEEREERGREEQRQREGKRDLEEGEMEEEEEEEEVTKGEERVGVVLEVGGRCYMDDEAMETRDDLTRDVSEDDSADSPIASEHKSGRDRRRSRSRSHDSSYKSRKKRSHRRHDSDNSDYDRYSDGGYKRSSRRRSSHHHGGSSSSKRRRGDYDDRSKGRYRGDDDSDYSPDEYYHHHSSKRRRERSYSPNEYEPQRPGKSSRRSGKGLHYGSSRYRSRSRDSYDDPERARERKTPSSGKHKKKDKKKRRKRSTSRNGSGDEKVPKPAPNVLVGKVGKISTVRPLGQEKKPEEAPAVTEQPVSAQQQQLQVAPDPSAYANMDPSQMSATYYQQPSTGQVPYYGTYGYHQYPYAQEAAYAQPQSQQPVQAEEVVAPQQQREQQQQQQEWKWGGADPVKWAAEAAAKSAEEAAVKSPEAEASKLGSEGGVGESGEGGDGGANENVSEMAVDRSAEVQTSLTNNATTVMKIGTEQPPVLETIYSSTGEQEGRVSDQPLPPPSLPVPPPPPAPLPPESNEPPNTALQQQATEQDRSAQIDHANQPPVEASPLPAEPEVPTQPGQSEIMYVSMDQTELCDTTVAEEVTLPSVVPMTGPDAEIQVEVVGPPPPEIQEPLQEIVATTSSSEQIVTTESAPPVPQPVQGSVAPPPPLPEPQAIPPPETSSEAIPPPPPTAPPVETEEEIAECEMEIDDSPSPAPVEQEGAGQVGVVSTPDVQPPLPPPEIAQSDSELTNRNPDADNTSSEPNLYEGITESLTTAQATYETPPTTTTTSDPAPAAAGEVAPPNSMAAAAYLQAATTQSTAYAYNPQQQAQQQAQQAYNYAYAQNYNQYAYMQQAAAYGAAYGMQPAATAQYYQGMYPAYGSYATTATAYYPPTYSSVPPPVPQQAPVVASTPSAVPVTKSKGFTLSGNKEKQVKTLMEKWNSFKEEEKS